MKITTIQEALALVDEGAPFGPEVRRIFESRCQVLIGQEALTDSDIPNIYSLAVDTNNSYELMRIVEVEGMMINEVSTKGLSIKKAHPALVMLNRVQANINRFNKLYGFTPSSRKNLDVRDTSTVSLEDVLGD